MFETWFVKQHKKILKLCKFINARDKKKKVLHTHHTAPQPSRMGTHHGGINFKRLKLKYKN